MSINLEAVGTVTGPVERSWTSDQALLYAVGVGAGTDELAFTTENSAATPQRVLPTYATIIGAPAVDFAALADIDRTKLVHGDEQITLFGPIPPIVRLSTVSTIASIEDKGSGALITIEAVSTDVESGAACIAVRMGLFLKGAGGFGGTRAQPTAHPALPDRDPDHVVEYATRADQALTFRLSGDRNPLHSDPVFAQRAGFPRPILHGLCTYGFSGRALLRTLCDGDPAGLVSMSGRFSSPVFPGESLAVQMWRTGGSDVVFRTVVAADRRTVIDQGHVELAP